MYMVGDSSMLNVKNESCNVYTSVHAMFHLTGLQNVCDWNSVIVSIKQLKPIEILTSN